MSLSNFPGSIDTIYDPSTNDTLATANHHLLHGQANDAITAIETKLGTGSSNQTAASGYFLQGTGSGASSWIASPTSPSFTTGINDVNSKQIIGFTPAGSSAVNYIGVSNSNTTVTPTVYSGGSDTNINLNLVPKGSGKVQDNGTSLVDFRSSFFNFVSAGGVWTAGSGLTASMTAAIIFINGIEYSVSLVSNHTFAASSDTYVDYIVGSGITYTAVANNAASPTLASNAVRIAIIVTSASTVSYINQGQPNATLPISSSIPYSVTDSLGNIIYPNDPNSRLIGYRQITAGISNVSVSSSPAQIAGLSVPCIIPIGRKATVTTHITEYVSANGTTTPITTVWDGVVNSGTQIGAYATSTLGATGYIGGAYFSCPPQQPSYTGSTFKTYNAAIQNTASLTLNLSTGSNSPSYIKVELD